MSSHPREFSEASAASHDSALSRDARIARKAEEILSKELSSSDDGAELSKDIEDDEDSDEEAIPDPLPSSADQSTSDESSTYEILRRTLSVRTVVSTSSSFAERMELAKLLENAPLSVIGRGTCGTVFEIPGTETAIKKGVDKDGLWNDANLTNVVCRAVVETRSLLESKFPDASIPRVPRVYGWVSNDELDSWWVKNKSRFPEDDATGYLFQVQRILPLPRSARIALIRTYFHPRMQDDALEDPENNACLVRPYLGLSRGEREFDRPAATLQNFPLYLDQLEEIGLNILQFSKEMAIGLAITHWKAGLDGMDMEFVIGSATIDSEIPDFVENFKNVKPFSIPAGDFKRRQTHLWMLDFDKAEQLDFKDWKSVRDRMVTAVTGNDPYYPNPVAPGDTEKTVWSVFEKSYLQTAEMLIELPSTSVGKKSKATKYPAEFLRAWRKRAQELEKTKDGSFVVFGD
jgi:hypothetical protein